MTEINVRPYAGPKQHKDAVADALRELNKQVKKSGLRDELRKREGYLPPSVKRTRKRKRAKAVRTMEERKANRAER